MAPLPGELRLQHNPKLAGITPITLDALVNGSVISSDNARTSLERLRPVTAISG